MTGNLIIGGSDGRVLLQGATHVVRHNVFYGNETPSGAVQPLLWTYGTVEATNNIFVLGDGDTVDVGDVTGSHNLFTSSAGAFGSDAIIADPLFVDAAGGDFRLQAASPAHDAGMDDGTTWDIAGNPVPMGDAPDLGAYETVE